MKTIKFIVTLILGISCVVYCGYLTQQQTKAAQLTSHEPRATSSDLMSIAEFQDYLNRLDPRNPIAVDGRLGPETQKKWDKVYCNIQAVKYFTTSELKHMTSGGK